VSDWLLLLVSLALVAACGVFVAAEFSFLAVNRAAIEDQSADGDTAARGVLRALRSLSTQLSGAQVGITVTNLAIGLLAQPAIGRLLNPLLADIDITDASADTISILVGLIVATVVTMVFGELVPKNLALANPEAVAKAVQGPNRFFTALTKPLSGGFNATANAIVRALGVEPSEELATARNPQELVSLVRHSATTGTLSDRTAGLLKNALTFDDQLAGDVMTPRIKVRHLPAGASMIDLLRAAAASGRSRFPVTGEDIDDVVGVVNLVEAFAVPADQRSTTAVATAARPVHAVPGTLPVDDVLALMVATHTHMVIVVDEYGGLDGVITREDLVEELVGELDDEHDDPRDSAGAVSNVGPWRLSGLLRPDEVFDLTGVWLPDESDYETIAGLIVSRLHRIARVGDSVEIGDAVLRVETMDRLRIDRVTLSRRRSDLEGSS